MKTESIYKLFFVCVVFISTLFGIVLLSHAQSTNQQITEGVLRVLGEEGKPIATLPLKHTKVDASISGFMSDVTVTQTFQNPSKDAIEALYVFPLPQNAAVYEMMMKIGDRTIKGQIKLREEARKIYEQAKSQGKVASLLDQERPNIFTQSVANIMPGHEIEIVIKYVNVLPYEKGEYEFVFPMVVGPRFIPGEPTSQAKRGSSPNTNLVPDASKITPPYLTPDVRSGHDIEVSVTLNAGVPITYIQTDTHQVKTTQDGTKATITLQPFDSIPNKDFVLRYGVAGDQIETGFLTHRIDNKNGFFTLMIPPIKDIPTNQVTPKEMVFVVDTSGSMSGEPLAKVKAAMRHALQNMNPHDTFKIILFSSTATEISSKPLNNTPENIQKGLAFIDQMQSGGGTMMMKGVEAALDPKVDPERVRIVLFMTDGYIGNESEILAGIQDKQNQARVFSFGVGSSVNRYLLDEMARVGRGAVEYITLNEETEPQVKKFYDRISKPFLTDISIETSGVELKDIYPEKIPDLFSAQPVVVHGRYKNPGKGTILVKGKLAGKNWQKSIEVQLPAENKENQAIASVWARTRIADLSRKNYHGDQAEIVQQITKLALEYHLMSAYTSFVAVEEKVVREEGQPLRTVEVPLEMPQGVSYQGVFGEKTDTETSGVNPQGVTSPAPSSKTYSFNSIKDRSANEDVAFLQPQMTLEMSPVVYKKGEPMKIKFTYVNPTAQEMKFSISSENIILIGPNGQKISPRLSKNINETIAKGETKTIEVPLSDLFDIKDLGIYVVEVKKIGDWTVNLKPVVFRVE